MNLLLPAIALSISMACSCGYDPATIKKECVPVNRLPTIRPDYTGIIVPPNIAPLDFIVSEPGTGYYAEIGSKHGKPISIASRGSSLYLPANKWKTLLEQNRGELLHINLYVREKTGPWRSYTTIEDTIATFPIDAYLTYRLLSIQYNYSTDLRLCQRELGSFRESELLNTNNYSWGCCNCHTPCNNDPNRFIFHSRSKVNDSATRATIIAVDGILSAIKATLGYPAWHPGGKMIAFATAKVQQCFHSLRNNIIEFYDNNSDIVLYDVVEKKITIVPQLHRKQTLETWPNWSPDGRYLYFCAAPILWTDGSKVPPDNFNKVRYSLLRISYNEADNAWGTVDTVLSAQATGLSISQPRCSPDNRFLLFCMHEYGAYPNTQKSSDLYLMDLAAKSFRKLDINSDYNETWHGWSKNGRWILFSSKRNGGIFSRVYFSFVDSGGTVHKPFILPQDDPAFYDSFIKSYNVPEFAVAPVAFSERRILHAVLSPEKTEVPMPQTPETGTPASTWIDR